MPQLLQSLNQNSASALLLLGVLVVALTVLSVLQTLAFRRMRAKWQSLLRGNDSDNLEGLLERHMTQHLENQGRLDDAHDRIQTLERKMRSAKRYVGLVRFDAFDDVGGNQSFSLAVYDEEGNGAVVTSLVGREGCRVYGKGLVNGKPERHLTAEEEMAIEQATSAKARPRISP